MKRGHKPDGRICGYPYCLKCGLVYLKNTATQKAVSKPCPGDRV